MPLIFHLKCFEKEIHYKHMCGYCIQCVLYYSIWSFANRKYHQLHMLHIALIFLSYLKHLNSWYNIKDWAGGKNINLLTILYSKTLILGIYLLRVYLLNKSQKPGKSFSIFRGSLMYFYKECGFSCVMRTAVHKLNLTM